ncbi:RuBisCO large subunit C-terminal-like domain-containing protein [Persephonella sp.]
MNYIEATYLLSSRKKFNPAVRIEVYLKSVFGEIDHKHFPFPMEIEEFYDSDFKLHKALVKIKFPVIIFEHNLYSILTLLYGEIVIPENAKLISVEFPPVFVDHFKGPKLGIKGIRDLLEEHHRPLLMVAVKPMNGMTEEQYRHQLSGIAAGGVDLIREDENFFDDSFLEFEKRIKLAVSITEGKRYIPFLSGSIDTIKEKIKIATDYGIKLFLINMFPIGMEGLKSLSDQFSAGFLVNPGYPSFFYENDLFGIEPSVLYGRFIRLAGADMVFIPSPYRHKTVPHYRSVEVANSLTERFEDIKSSFPVVYGSITPENIYDIFKDFGSQVVIDICGEYRKYGKTSEEGVRIFSEALRCVMSGVPYERCAEKAEKS